MFDESISNLEELKYSSYGMSNPVLNMIPV